MALTHTQESEMTYKVPIKTYDKLKPILKNTVIGNDVLRAIFVYETCKVINVEEIAKNVIKHKLQKGGRFFLPPTTLERIQAAARENYITQAQLITHILVTVAENPDLLKVVSDRVQKTISFKE